MSTKIYTGWRVPGSRLGRFTNEFDHTCLGNALTIAANLMTTVTSERIQERLATIKNNWWVKEYGEEKAIKLMKARQTLALLVYQSRRSTRFPGMDIDCGFVAHPDGTYFNIWPTGEFSLIEGFDYTKCGARDWSYWNNSDPDEDVTPQEWGRRAASWNRVLDGNNDYIRLFRETISMKNCTSQLLFSDHFAKHIKLPNARQSAGWLISAALDRDADHLEQEIERHKK